jgi:UPF0755 protein
MRTKKVKKIKVSSAKNSKFRKVLISLLVIIALGAVGMGYELYLKFYQSNIYIKGAEKGFLYIPTGSDFNKVLQVINQNGCLINKTSFEWVARKLDYPKHIHPGKYLLKKGMSNKDLVFLLRSGKQVPVKLVLNGARTIPQLASKVSQQLEVDSVSIVNMLSNNDTMAQYGFNGANSMAMFIPNTYEFYWDTSAKGFLDKLIKGYNKFWNDTRLKKAESIGYTPMQVSVLASIIEQETHKNDEKPVVAGVYINRLHAGHKLEADPTLVFALGNFSVKRVLSAYKEIDSPYNTYMYAGLPPGPICMPSPSSIDAVLNYTKHDYFYFCAREDFSGYHNFAKTYDMQMKNAHIYQHELNKRNIKS